MTARRAVVVAALLAALVAGADAGHAQVQPLVVTFQDSNPNPAKPTQPLNSLKDLALAIAGCFTLPPVDRERQPVDVIFQVSFKRSGELFGKPRTVEFNGEVTPQQRAVYYAAVAEALDRCSPLPFTEAMGGAVAGRVFRITFVDMRNRKKAELQWPTMKTG